MYKKRPYSQNMHTGVIPIKGEGLPCHPDAMFLGAPHILSPKEYSDKRYLEQLQAYANEWGLERTLKTMCSRPYLLNKLREKKDVNP